MVYPLERMRLQYKDEMDDYHMDLSGMVLISYNE
jgi:hypothetical protein